MNKTKLPSPVAKRRCKSTNVYLPLPLLFSEVENDSTDTQLDVKFTGIFNGYNVVVRDHEKMITLYTMGCFGKGSLSRGYPCFKEKKRSLTTVLQEERWKQCKHRWQMILSNNCSDVNNFYQFNNDAELILSNCSTSQEKNLDDELHMAFSKSVNNYSVLKSHAINVDNENECAVCENHITKSEPHYKKGITKTLKEELHLLLEEAFFLSYALGCLKIYYSNKLVCRNILWNLFRNSQCNFVNRYIAYHYFRAKGWVVKPGTKYGGDFLLYKEGPIFYHSTYVVIVKRIFDKDNDFNWLYLQALNRSAQAAKKIVLICQISIPDDFNEDDVMQLSRCKVSELILDRWVASENRE